MLLQKYYKNYFLVVFLYFIIATFIRRWLDISFAWMWLGAFLGSILPDIDSLIHFYFLKPHELTSQRFKKMVNDRKYLQSLELIYKTKTERKDLLFHSILFQVIFIVFSFYVLSSTSSLFGRGLVLSFLLHLLVDQYTEFKATKSLSSWFHNLKMNFSEKEARNYLYAMIGVLVFFGLVV